VPRGKRREKSEREGERERGVREDIGGPFDLPIFKAGRLEFTSCLSKRPFPHRVITAHDPGRDFRFSFSGLRARYAGI